jgi:hypothetical protein
LVGLTPQFFSKVLHVLEYQEHCDTHIGTATANGHKVSTTYEVYSATALRYARISTGGANVGSEFPIRPSNFNFHIFDPIKSWYNPSVAEFSLSDPIIFEIYIRFHTRQLLGEK